MLLQAPSKIMLATAPIDMRKSYQGLGVLVQNVLNQDPFSSTAFVFTNKKKISSKFYIGISMDFVCFKND